MTRHFFDTELHCQVRVRLGHVAMGEFFLEVEWIAGNPDLGFSRFLYNSLDDPFNCSDDLDYYRDKLEQLGIVVPESLFQAVADDALRGTESRFAQHFADGRIVEPVQN